MLEVFGIAFSIMGLLPSIASTLAYSIPAGLYTPKSFCNYHLVLTYLIGPAGMVWGWFLASMFIFFVGLAMADLGLAMPTSGGLYWFVQPYQQSWTTILTTQVDTLLLIAIDTQRLLFPRRLQQHPWSSRRALLH